MCVCMLGGVVWGEETEGEGRESTGRRMWGEKGGEEGSGGVGVGCDKEKRAWMERGF